MRMTAKELWGAERCGVCQENFHITDSDIAEMVNPADGKHHIVHYMCGQGRGMELA